MTTASKKCLKTSITIMVLQCSKFDSTHIHSVLIWTLWVYILRKCLHNLQKIPRIFWLVVVIFVHRWLGFIPYLMSERSTRNFSVFSEPFWRWFSLVLLRFYRQKIARKTDQMCLFLIIWIFFQLWLSTCSLCWRRNA